ncbi:MAG: hypothetical protein V1718_05920, partial [archaeon]
RSFVFVGVFVVFLLGFVGVAGNNAGWFDGAMSDGSDGAADVTSDQEYTDKPASGDEPVKTKTVVEDPVVEYTDPKVVDTRETVMTSNGEIKGTVVDKAGIGYIVVELDGERLPDYEFVLDPAWESVYEKKGLWDVFKKYDIKNHAIEKFNTNGKPGYDKVKVLINVKMGSDGKYDIQNSGMIVYDGEIRNSEAINYISLCLHPDAKKVFSEERRKDCILRE